MSLRNNATLRGIRTPLTGGSTPYLTVSGAIRGETHG